MPKDKISLTIDPDIVADTDRDASEDGLNRSEYVEKTLRDAHYRRLLARTRPDPAMRPDESAHLRSLLAWQARQGEAA